MNRFLSTRSSIDFLFRLAIGIGFAYMILAGTRMPRTSFGSPGLYPIFVGTIGLLMWIGLHIHDLLRRSRSGRIFDIAYDFSDLPAHVVRRRTLQTFAMLAALMLGVWLLSFQLAVPLFLLVTLRVMARSSWLVAAAWMIALELLIVVVFGDIAHIAWPRSILEGTLGISFQSVLGAPFRTLLPV